MDNQILFGTFLLVHIGLGVIRANLAVTQILPTFTSLLTVTETNIDDCIKSIHSANSARVAVDRIIIPPITSIIIKAMRFEILDCSR